MNNGRGNLILILMKRFLIDTFLAVILTPTRELAIQINRECKKFATSLGLRSVCVYGGTGISEQIAELKRGTEIIVCTPGRMIDMLAANNGKGAIQFPFNFSRH